jgi:ParB-like chromosome segregation protein Spo0J
VSDEQLPLFDDPGSRGETVPLDHLRPFPGNPRRGDVDAIVRSLDRFGQRKPVVALKDGTVLAGNHIMEAARRLGWTSLWVSWWTGTEEEARAFVLADNRTSELGTVDESDLYALLLEVQAFENDLLDAASYSLDDLADLAHALSPPDLDRLVAEHGEPTPEDFWPVVRVKVRPDLYAVWQTLVTRYDGEDVAFGYLISLVPDPQETPGTREMP